MKSDVPSSFAGEYYQIKDAILLPRPAREGGPPILIGGNGVKRTLPLAARFADEWNGVYPSLELYAELNKRLDDLAVKESRDPGEIRRSVMIGCEYGRDQAEVERLVQDRTSGQRTIDELRNEFGMAVGTGQEITEHLEKLADSGCQRVMLQWLALDDLERLESLAAEVLTQFK
jgi:alkanesulfonate monooxygenase SsuD/methylene tetrahydromethanopterin reductase-like flavin-dependent oxidoreductase (luciferase family)